MNRDAVEGLLDTVLADERAVCGELLIMKQSEAFEIRHREDELNGGALQFERSPISALPYSC